MFWISHSASTSAMESNLIPSLKQFQKPARSPSNQAPASGKASLSKSSTTTSTRSFWSKLTGSSTATTRSSSPQADMDRSQSHKQPGPAARPRVHFLPQQAPKAKTGTNPIPLPAPHWRAMQIQEQIRMHTEAPQELTEEDCNGTLYLSSGSVADFQLNEYNEVMPVVPECIKATGKEPRWLQPWEETDEGVYGDVYSERPSILPEVVKRCADNPHKIVEVAQERGRSRRRRSPPPSEELIDWV